MGIKSLLFPTKGLCYLCRERYMEMEGTICADCLDRLECVNKDIDMESKFIKRTLFCLTYNRFLKELVHDFKFNGKSYMYKPFAEIIIKSIRENGLNYSDLIMFVPIHRRKEALRGYNQSELLASYTSKTLGIKLSKKNLIKVKWTKEQNTLDRIERLNNLSDSFILKNPDEVAGKRILLMDDIITTGSTLNECAKILYNNGAREINCIALTSGKRF